MIKSIISGWRDQKRSLWVAALLVTLVITVSGGASLTLSYGYHWLAPARPPQTDASARVVIEKALARSLCAPVYQLQGQEQTDDKTIWRYARVQSTRELEEEILPGYRSITQKEFTIENRKSRPSWFVPFNSEADRCYRSVGETAPGAWTYLSVRKDNGMLYVYQFVAVAEDE